MRTAIRVLLIVCFLFCAVSAKCQSGPLDAIAASHVEANVPAPADFDRFLRRDLGAYFGSKASHGLVNVEYELLRQGPTQSGVAYPKFYAWVQVRENGQLLHEGAVRLAAIERRRFEITNFLSADDIRRSPDAITRVFPAPVCDRLQEKVGLDKRSDIPPNARLQTVRVRFDELGPQAHKRESFIAHLRSLGRWEADAADYPDPGVVSFPERLHVAYAVCHPECGAREFIVDGSTQKCQKCGGLMFRTDVAEYRLVPTPAV